LQLLNQQHLVDIVAGQSICGSNDDDIEISHAGPIAQIVQARAIECCTAVAVVAEDVCVIKRPALLLDMCLQARELLLDRLGLGLPEG
jgi:hypothetical protein